jgi:Ca2+-binding RTX toxin-like protein
MANIGYSFLTNGLVYLVNPINDKVVFTDPLISAAEVRLFESDGRAVLHSTVENKLVGFNIDQTTKLLMAQFTSTNVTFADGSVLKIGDETIGHTDDNLANTLIGLTKDDHLIGLGGNDTLKGAGGNDFLEGGAGDDRLDGGAGADVFLDTRGANRFLGAGGDDAFTCFSHSVAENGANVITGGTGRDTYYVTIGSILHTDVNFSVTDYNVSATTGDLINIFTPLAQMAASGFYNGQNPLTGGFVRVLQSGDDALVQTDFDGTGGSFTWETVLKIEDRSAANVDNTFTGYVLGDGTNNNLAGNATNQFLWGGAGNDTLNGGAGNDNMFGGAGNDTYHVDNGSDAITDVVAGGTDTVLATVNFALGSNVENLKLTGTVAKEGTGNTLNNSITGNNLANLLKGGAGNDNLNGAVGADSVLGGAGDDKMVWGAGDTLLGEAGTDTVKVAAGSLDLTLVANTAIQAERIDMIAGGNNTLKLAMQDVLDLSTETNEIIIVGNTGDKVQVVGGFTLGALAGGFRTYNLTSGALLKVETDVDVIAA